MNIGEANDVNTVTRYLLGIGGHAGPVTDEEAVAAWELLTQKAQRVLSAGLRPEEIRPAFAALKAETETLQYWVLAHQQRRERLLRLLKSLSGWPRLAFADEVQDILDLPGCRGCPPGCGECSVDSSTCMCHLHPDASEASP